MCYDYLLYLIPNNDKASLSKIYPVGAIIVTTVAYANSAAVVAVYGGTTWTEVGNGYFLKAVGTGNTAGNTAAAGNTGSTTLTAAQSGVPAHSHGLNNHTHSIPQLDVYTYYSITGGIGQNGVALGNTTAQAGNILKTTANTTGEASGSTANNTAANASQGHTHTAGNPASYGVHIWKRTA